MESCASNNQSTVERKLLAGSVFPIDEILKEEIYNSTERLQKLHTTLDSNPKVGNLQAGSPRKIPTISPSNYRAIEKLLNPIQTGQVKGQAQISEARLKAVLLGNLLEQPLLHFVTRVFPEASLVATPPDWETGLEDVLFKVDGEVTIEGYGGTFPTETKISATELLGASKDTEPRNWIPQCSEEEVCRLLIEKQVFKWELNNANKLVANLDHSWCTQVSLYSLFRGSSHGILAILTLYGVYIRLISRFEDEQYFSQSVQEMNLKLQEILKSEENHEVFTYKATSDKLNSLSKLYSGKI